VGEAAANLPAEVIARFETGEKLSDGDREVTMELARQALAGFLTAPEPEEETEQR